MDNNISLRLHNNTYAPGIATYGIQGKMGEQGEPGTSMFFTDYDINQNSTSTDKSLFIKFAEKITSRKLPLSTIETVLDRKYINGDLFVTTDGIVYMLIDIDKLSKDLANGYENHDITNYLLKVGNFSLTDSIFTNSNTLKTNHLVLTDDPESNNTSTGQLTINRKNKINGSVSFINLNALYGNTGNINLDINYDNTLKAFVFKSQYPIVLDANTFVKYDGTLNKLGEYSPVLTSNNTITDFYGMCSYIDYNIDASIYNYTHKDSSTIYYGCVYQITLDIDTDQNIKNMLVNYNKNSSLNIHYQNGAYQDMQIYRNSENTYYFKQDYEIVKLNELLNKIQNTEFNNIQISLLDSIEVYLTKKTTKIIGFND